MIKLFSLSLVERMASSGSALLYMKWDKHIHSTGGGINARSASDAKTCMNQYKPHMAFNFSEGDQTSSEIKAQLREDQTC